MPLWQFFDYYPDEGGCPIREWSEAQDVKVRAVFDATVADLAMTEDWEDEDLLSFDVLRRRPEHVGLAEVRFYVIQNNKKTNYRAIGRWRTEAREFIFLMGFQKNGRPTIPPNALQEAVRLLNQLNQGRGEIHEHFSEDVEEADGGQAVS
jgi:hypothetical protein